MDKILESLASKDAEFKKLFSILYVDMGAERAFRDVQIAEKFKKELVPVPVVEQIQNIKKILEEKNIHKNEEEIANFAIEFGRLNFNFLFKK